MIYDLFRRKALRAVHPHIQRRILHIGEAAFGIVQLIGGNTDVKQDPVQSADAPFFQDPDCVLIVCVDPFHLISEGFEPFPGGCQCFLILIKTVQPAMLSQPRCDLAAMSGTAQRAVHIDAVRPDCKSFEHFI